MPVDENEPKYKKPKILLIDLPESTLQCVKSAGFNVNSGTFGSPYKVPVSDSFWPVGFSDDLPNLSEQEIIIMDLIKPESIQQQNPKVTYETRYYYIKCSNGEIDSRRIAMHLEADNFERIYNRGGLIVIFAAYIRPQTIRFGTAVDVGFGNVADLQLNEWPILLFMEYLTINFDQGSEITVLEEVPIFTDLFKKYVDNAEFEVKLKPIGYLSEMMIPLLENKFGECVGGIISQLDKGSILILPQFSKKDELIIELLKNVFPELYPHLFPEFEGLKWVERDDYEFDSIKILKFKIKELEDETRRKIIDINKEISQEREEFGFLHGIITKTGIELVKDIESSLKHIGFTNVINVDETEGYSNLQEDIQIKDNKPILLLEVKGFSGFPNESDSIQITKYMLRRTTEWKENVGGVFIVNHQRNIPCLERDNANVFTKQQISDALGLNITLMTTWDLHLLIKGMLKWGWNTESIRELFYKRGRLERIPSCYKPIGKIVKYFKEASAIAVNLYSDDALCEGDKIGYILPNGYFEEQVTSLQVNGKQVPKANPGDGIGIKTIYSSDMLHKGMDVYLIE